MARVRAGIINWPGERIPSSNINSDLNLTIYTYIYFFLSKFSQGQPAILGIEKFSKVFQNYTQVIGHKPNNWIDF